MAFEGLLARLGPSFVREISPHLLPLLSGFLDRFRKDTSAMKAAVDTEVASLRQAQASLAATSAQQAEAVTALREQLGRVENKVDHLQESHDAVGHQLTALEEHLRTVPRSPTWLLWLVFVIGLLNLGAIIGFFLLHR